MFGCLHQVDLQLLLLRQHLDVIFKRLTYSILVFSGLRCEQSRLVLFFWSDTHHVFRNVVVITELSRVGLSCTLEQLPSCTLKS